MTETRGTYRAGEPGEIHPDTLLAFDAPGYRSPGADDVREAVRLSGLSGGGVAQLVGVGDARTVQRWIGGDRQMPYSAWRLLLIYIGKVEPELDPAAGEVWDGPVA